MTPDSMLIRGRVERVETTASAETVHGESSETWGGFEASAVFDNEDYDSPQHKLSLAELAAGPRTFRVIRYQNQDPELADVTALAQSPMFQEVAFLDLKRNFRAPSDEQWADLIASGLLAHLRFLGLDSCYPVADATMAAIASGAMPKLEALEIGCTDVTDDGLFALANATATPALQVVQGMYMSKLSAAGIEALAHARPNLVLRFTRG